MWEAIAANRQRSQLLIGLMGVILLTLGGCIGMYAAVQMAGGPGHASSEIALRGGGIGASVALVIWLALWLTAVFQGDRILLHSAGAREMRDWDDRRLWNIVDEMTIASGLEHKPRVYLIENSDPNAFAVGRKSENAAVAVTSGLLRLLDRDELQGVVAHEIAHIRNLDIRFMTMASVLVAGVELISRGFLRGLIHSGGGGRRTGKPSKGGGLPLLIIVVVIAILSPIAVRLLYLACSRWREYLADCERGAFHALSGRLGVGAREDRGRSEGARVREGSRGIGAALYHQSIPIDGARRAVLNASSHGEPREHPAEHGWPRRICGLRDRAAKDRGQEDASQGARSSRA